MGWFIKLNLHIFAGSYGRMKKEPPLQKAERNQASAYVRSEALLLKHF